MLNFRRAIRLLLTILGVLAGTVAGLVAYFSRMMIRPPRQRFWATPADVGLAYESVQFPARDGLRISGWFVPGKETANGRRPTTLILVHGWPWNRLGTDAENILTDLPGSSPVHLLRLVKDLYEAGYQLFMFDLRNHGQSASSAPVTFGLSEANDLLGAIDCLTSRADVDGEHIGVIGFAMGANTLLFSLPRTERIKAAIAVQPASPNVFWKRYLASLFGPLGKLIYALTDAIYTGTSGLRISAIEPVFSAAGIGNVPVLYVQGKGDPWGSKQNVARMAQATHASIEPLYVDSIGHYGGFQYVIDNPHLVDQFFRKHIA